MENTLKGDEAGHGETRIGECMAKLSHAGRNRESHDEIAELQAELRRAYVAKELQAQLLEKEADRYVECVRRQRAERLMRLEQQAALENDLRQRSECLKKSEDYRRELASQIERKGAEREMMMEEARREREILAEVDRIREECERSKTLQMKEELADSMRRERLIQQEMKLIRRAEDMEAAAKKELEDEEYLAEIDERARKARSLREERLNRRERTACEIASILLNRESDKREREALLVELLVEDVRLELLIKEEEERIRRKRLREELAADLGEQISLAERCKMRCVEQDRAFGEEIMKKIMEDEKTGMLTAGARRRMQLQYREDLARLIETRRRIRDEEISNMRRVEREERQRERTMIERIAEDRKRLLQAHASNVAEFIDKNALSVEERKTVQNMLSIGNSK